MPHRLTPTQQAEAVLAVGALMRRLTVKSVALTNVGLVHIHAANAPSYDSWLEALDAGEEIVHAGGRRSAVATHSGVQFLLFLDAEDALPEQVSA